MQVSGQIEKSRQLAPLTKARSSNGRRHRGTGEITGMERVRRGGEEGSYRRRVASFFLLQTRCICRPSRSLDIFCPCDASIRAEFVPSSPSSRDTSKSNLKEEE